MTRSITRPALRQEHAGAAHLRFFRAGRDHWCPLKTADAADRDHQVTAGMAREDEPLSHLAALSTSSVEG